MKFPGPLLYIAVAAPLIAIPVYAASKLRADKPKIGETAELRNFQRPAPEVEVPGANWRPAWIIPTRQYKWKPPAVPPRIADRPEARNEKQANKPSKKEESYAQERTTGRVPKREQTAPSPALGYAAEESGGNYEPAVIGKD